MIKALKVCAVSKHLKTIQVPRTLPLGLLSTQKLVPRIFQVSLWIDKFAKVISRPLSNNFLMEL